MSDHFADELFKEPSLVKKMDSQKIGSIKANNVRGKDSSADKTSAQLVGSAAKSKETIQDSNK